MVTMGPGTMCSSSISAVTPMVRRGVNPGGELHHGIGPIDMPADGILIGEHALCESLADDSDGLFTLGVEVVEIAAAKDGHAERGKESCRDDAQLRARILVGSVNMTVGGELQSETARADIAPRNGQTKSGLSYAGEGINATNRFL